MVTALVLVRANEPDVLVCGAGITVEDLPSRGGGEVRDTLLGAGLYARK